MDTVNNPILKSSYSERSEYSEQIEINKTALKILLENLMAYGNTPDQPQITALGSLINHYTAIASGKVSGRFAFGIPTGGGKSQSIVAWITALALHKSRASVLVSASKVEALCTLKRDIENSLKKHQADISIGLLHSYKYDRAKAEELIPGYASEESTKNPEGFQVLLCTHSRIRGKADTAQYNLYQGKQRDIIIYDESLLIADTRGIDLREIQAGIDCLKYYTGKEGTKREALDYCRDALEVFLQELREQQQQKREPKQITLKPLEGKQVRDYIAALGEGNRKFGVMAGGVQTLLTFSKNPLRVLSTEQGSGFISYDLAVSPELKNIVILDASHNIRELCQLDGSVHTVHTSFNISHEKTKVKYWRHPAGRHTMTKDFRAKKKENRKISSEVCETVKTISPDEGILFFVFKRRSKNEPDFRKILEADLKASQIDTEAKLSDGRSRLNWLTWGSETSISEYSFCKHVFLVGVLHPPYIELAASMAGQLEDLCFEVTNKKIRQIELSECAHYIYQAFSRSSSRIIKNSKSEGATLWLIFNDSKVKDILDIVLPEAKWETWKTTKKQTSVEKIRETIREYLKAVPETVPSVSTQKIRKELNLKSIPKMAFTRAITGISDVSNWILSGRSVVRASKVFS